MTRVNDLTRINQISRMRTLEIHKKLPPAGTAKLWHIQRDRNGATVTAIAAPAGTAKTLPDNQNSTHFF